MIVKKWLEEHGWRVEQSGGGSVWAIRMLGFGGMWAAITDDSGFKVPETMDEPILVGVYDEDGSECAMIELGSLKEVK